MDERLLELERRLAAAERQLRRLRYSAFLAILGLALFAMRPTFSQRQGDQTRVPFRVIDAAGKPVLEVTSDARGRRLLLFDPAGKPGVRLVADAQGGLVATTAAGRDAAELSGSSHGGRLQLFNPAGRDHVRIRADGQGGHLETTGSAGQSLHLGADELGASSLTMLDGSGRVGVDLRALPRRSSLTLRHQVATPGNMGLRSNLLMLEASPSGADIAAFSRAADDRPVPDALFSAGTSGGQLHLRDTSGKATFRKP